MIPGNLIFQQHKGQHYKTLFDQKSGLFIRKEDYGYDEPSWAADGPELLDVAITNYCENGCQFCYRGSNIHGKHMPYAELKKIVDEAQKIGVLQIALGGGNPNQHPQFVDIIQYIRQNNIIPSYTSNGDGLTDDILYATSEYCGAMAISAYPPYDRMGNTLKRISHFGIKTNLHIIMKEDSLNTIIGWLKDPPDFIKYINALIFLNYKPINRTLKIQKIKEEKLREFFHAIKECDFVKIGFDSCSISGILSYLNVNSVLIEACEAARFSAFISEDMKMYPCSFMANTQAFGDLKDQSIKDIWINNPHFQKIRNIKHDNSCLQCSHYTLCKGGCPFMPEINLCDTTRYHL